eukprot:5276718-Heterocapsa_arctica.AAC.1
MSLDLDGVRITVPCVIIDNLNAIYDPNTGKFIGMSDDGWNKVREILVLMGRFRSRFYMCSAAPSRWGLGSGFDVTSERCRAFDKEMHIPCWA